MLFLPNTVDLADHTTFLNYSLKSSKNPDFKVTFTDQALSALLAMPLKGIWILGSGFGALQVRFG
tara:strand:+ start:106 stop:300 length:195 start_codon:yes stop_codon:yes gene_type:complete